MGGKALQNYGVFTERKNTEDFTRIGQEISTQVKKDLGVECTVVKCYHTKKSHGDLDLLIKIDSILNSKGINLKEYIANTFKPNAIHNNGGVYSFDYENFQVDFIPIKESNWEVALVYFSYDPLGNAMGKTFHKMNLSYGWDGLKYKYRNFNGRNSHDITLTKDARKIFEFGGFNYDRYLQGFDYIEEIFDFIIDSKYFNIEIFKMENLRHIDKKRNRKRKSYHEFLEYVNSLGITDGYVFNTDKSIYLPLINGSFPEANFFEKLTKLDERNEVNKRLSEKLNGVKIMSWIPGLEGKELGDVYREFKNDLGEQYEEYILNADQDEIKQRFIEFYEEQKQHS